MSLSSLLTSPYPGNHLSHHHQHSNHHPGLPQADSNMLSSLKHRLSRKEKSSSISNQNSFDNTLAQHPQSINSPATRRPLPTSTTRGATMNDAPPAYTPVAESKPFSSNNLQTSIPVSPPSPAPSGGADDPYAFLRTFDTVFLIDDSGSMAGGRWRETSEALATITPVCTTYDADGIDLYFLNNASHPSHKGIRRAETVREIFSTVRPRGSTPTGQRLHSILKPYISKYTASPATTKPLNLICITDGAATDDVESPIVAAAKALDRLDAPAWQVGVQFFQVGNDPEATRDLNMLDDELAEMVGRNGGDAGMRDIVDTVPFKGTEGEKLSGDGILKVVLGAVNRRLDRKKVVHSS